MLWLIYGTVNSAEYGEFTGAVKYPVLKRKGKESYHQGMQPTWRAYHDSA